MKSIAFVLAVLLVCVAGCGRKTEKVDTATETENLTSEFGMVTVESPTTETTATTQATSEIPVATTESAKDVLSQEAPLTAVAMEKPTVSNIQQALKNLGLYVGKLDGTLGPKTKKAIEEFQKQNNLKVDGKVGPKTWEKLKTHLTKAQ
ncbi:MAG: peptidoglycan-binding domain-containing protein [Candidatus Omnitrophota bacterium]